MWVLAPSEVGHYLLPNSGVETLTLDGTVFGDRAFLKGERFVHSEEKLEYRGLKKKFFF